MNCCICKKELKTVNDNGHQPYGGGNIWLEFTYGSTKFDNHMGITRYFGCICDDCAENIVPNLEEKLGKWNDF